MELAEGNKYECLVGGSDFTVGNVYISYMSDDGQVVIPSDSTDEFDEWGLDMWGYSFKEVL